MEISKRYFRNSQAMISSHLAILLLRVGLGSLMLTHGIPKLIKLVTGNLKFADPLGLGADLSFVLATFSELGCSLLIIVGLWTRLATIPLIITMSVAAFIHHASDPMAIKEKALLYLVGFTVILVSGGGKFSLDQKFFNRSNKLS